MMSAFMSRRVRPNGQRNYHDHELEFRRVSSKFGMTWELELGASVFSVPGNSSCLLAGYQYYCNTINPSQSSIRAYI